MLYGAMPDKILTAPAELTAFPPNDPDLPPPDGSALLDHIITARTFARLLIAFDIQPCVQRIGSDALARGYRLEDFMPHWQTHLGFNPTPVADQQSEVTDKHQSEIANNDKGCYAVTHSRALSVPMTVQTVLSTVSLSTVSLPAKALNLPENAGSSSRIPPQQHGE